MKDTNVFSRKRTVPFLPILLYDRGGRGARGGDGLGDGDLPLRKQ